MWARANRWPVRLASPSISDSPARAASAPMGSRSSIEQLVVLVGQRMLELVGQRDLFDRPQRLVGIVGADDELAGRRDVEPGHARGQEIEAQVAEVGPGLDRTERLEQPLVEIGLLLEVNSSRLSSTIRCPAAAGSTNLGAGSPST